MSGIPINIMDAVNDALTRVAALKRDATLPLRDVDLYAALKHQSSELLDCMGGRWPDHRQRLTTIAAWALLGLIEGEVE